MGLTMQAGFIVFLCKANVRLANVNGHSHLNVMCTGRNAWRQPAVLPPTIICVHSSVCIAVLVEIRWWVLVKADTQHWTFSWTSGHDTWPDTIWWCALVNDFVCCWKVCPVVSFAELRVEWRSVCVDQNTIVVGGDHLLSVARWLLVRNIAPTVGQVQAWLAVLAIRAHIVQLTLINLKVGVLPHKGPPTTSDAFVHQAVSLQNERTRESTLTSSPPRKGRSLCQKWVCSDHFLLEAAWKKKRYYFVRMRSGITLETQNVEKVSMNHHGQKRFSQNKSRRADLQNLNSDFSIFAPGLWSFKTTTDYQQQVSIAIHNEISSKKILQNTFHKQRLTKSYNY